MSHYRILRVVEFDLSDSPAAAIRHRRDDDQPDISGSSGTSKITGNTRMRARRYSRSIFSPSQELQAGTQTGYDIGA